MAVNDIQNPSELMSIWNYDFETGIIRWLIKPAKRVNIGDIATSCQHRKSGTDRLYLRYKGISYLAHRVAWAIYFGSWPDGEIDHINGDAADNRICNLRVVDRTNNCKNRAIPITNKSGHIGVWKHPRSGNWIAYIWKDGKQCQIGTFKDYKEACLARKNAEINNNFHPNHGRIKPPAARGE